ncbi:MAG: hypothetical protein ACREIC_00625, partial [Limisphaerales bacterium]
MLIATICLALRSSLPAQAPGRGADGHAARLQTETHVSEDFERIGSAMGVVADELHATKIENHALFIVASNARWAYHIDASGNRTFRPIANTPILTSLITSGKAKGSASFADLEGETRSLMNQLGFAMAVQNVEARQEYLLAENRQDGKLVSALGRRVVRLNGSENQFFQVIFGPKDKSTRLDTNLHDPSAYAIEDGLHRVLLSGKISQPFGQGIPITLSTFFQTNEYRFESCSLKWESESFLATVQTSNPYQRGNYRGMPEFLLVHGGINGAGQTDLDGPVDFGAWRETSDYRYWTFRWWVLDGKGNGVRGNWNTKGNAWENGEVSVGHHRLSDYTFVAGEPTKTKRFTMRDGTQVAFPNADDKIMERRFYFDLEDSSVAVFLCHGSPSHESIKLCRARDTWFLPCDNGHLLGVGKLRHLFFASCSTMSWMKSRRHGERNLTLTRDWLPGTYVDGLRTACGCDDELVQ